LFDVLLVVNNYHSSGIV